MGNNGTGSEALENPTDLSDRDSIDHWNQDKEHYCERKGEIACRQEI